MTLQVSASKSELLLQCQRPFSLGVETDDEVGEPALYGSGFHSLMEVPTWRPEVLYPIAKKLEVRWSLPGAADEWVDHVRASKRVLWKWLKGANDWGLNFTTGKILREAAFAVNPYSMKSRRVKPPTVEGHVYEGIDPSCEVPGTADLVSLYSMFPLVLDYKTGRDPLDFLTVPEDVSQIRTLGLAAYCERFKHGVNLNNPPVAEIILAVLHAPRDSAPAVYADAVGVDLLQRHALELQDALRRRGDGSMRKGPCCKICPARHDCPLQLGDFLRGAGTALEVGGRPANELKDIVEYGPEHDKLTTGNDVGKFHYFREKMFKIMEAGQSLSRDWVAENPDEISVRPDGKILIVKEKTVRQLSLASIVRALGKVKGQELIDELEALGVIETQTRLELHAIDPDR